MGLHNIECDVNKNKIIRSLNLYLTECQSQYTDCFGEASEQAALLELQRDAIGALQKRIKFLEFDELLNAFMLHFIYYFIVYKYQKELETRVKAAADLQNQIDHLAAKSSNFERQCHDLRFECEKASKDIENERNGFEKTREKILREKQTEIDKLLRENNDLKKQLQALKVDFKLIEEEMKKMGVPDQSIEQFRDKLEDMRLKQLQLNCHLDKQNQMISSLNEEISCKNDNLKQLNSQLIECKNAVCQKEQELKHLRSELKGTKTHAATYALNIDKMARVIEGQQVEIAYLNEKVQHLKTELDKLQCTYSILESQRALCENELNIENYELKKQLSKAHERLKNDHQLVIQLENRIKALTDSRRKSSENQQPLDYSETVISNQLAAATQKNKELEQMVIKLKATIDENKKELGSKNNALVEIQAKFNQLSAKFESSERSCHRFKEEVQVIEKSLNIQKLKTQNCTEKNEELIRQNKSLEESNNKCMEELEDIVLQLEDMQSSLVELRNECDRKTQSLECVSVELEKMKVSRSEVCDESKYVLQWVRDWMREQKTIVKILQDKLYEKQHRLLAVCSEKKKFMDLTKKLRRKHRVLVKRLRLIRKPAAKQVDAYANGYTLPPKQCARCSSKQKNGLNAYNSRSACEKDSKAVLSVVKLESRKGASRPECVKMQGDSKLISELWHISKELPKTSQIVDIIQHNGKVHEEVENDNGYHTSGSKSSFS